MSKFMNEYMGFKVGDRVKVVHGDRYVGKTGTIYKIDTDVCMNIDVILDDFNTGHDGHANDGSHNHRYYDVEDLTKIEKPTSTTKYNVGDTVTVRSDLFDTRYYGGICPSEQMLTKAGKKVKIKAVTKTGRYKIEGSCFTWTDEMFEEKTEPKKETTKTKVDKSPRFKAGDKVRVRADLKPSYTTRYFMADGHTDDTFVAGMDRFCGEIVTIREIISCGKYRIEGSEYNWVDEMFEDQKVEPTKNREPKVGDRIRMTDNYCWAKTGMTGVIKTKRSNNFGVEFDDEFPGGHKCGGYTKPNRGHWVYADRFEIIDEPKYFIVTVTFNNDNEYCYLSDITVKKGDKVVVPCGSCDRETIATVVKTGKYTETNAPYPVDKMKKVIRKGTDTKPTSENGFDWDKFKETEIIVHCRTQKSWDNFLEECEKRDIKWNDGKRATYYSDMWSRNNNQSSIVYNLNRATAMTQTRLEWHRKELPTAAIYDWTSKKYVDKPVAEKKVETKPTPKIEVGDVVRAIDNCYGITKLNNEWEGIVIATTNDEFTALTTHEKHSNHASYTRFFGLDPKHFEIIKKNT